MSELAEMATRHTNKQQQVFSNKEELLLAQQLKALAHPVRLQILQSLGDRNNCCCNDICASIPLAQSTISQHLKILSKAGIIDFQAVGNCSHYSLNATVLTQTINAFSKLREITGLVDTCDCPKGSEQQMPIQNMPVSKTDNQ